MTELEYHPAASDEVAQSFDWYYDIAPAVAQNFKVELERAESLVLRSPEAWGPYLHDTKGFRFRGFPFAMAYIIRDNRIIVIAVAHTKRRPGYWKDRLPG